MYFLIILFLSRYFMWYFVLPNNSVVLLFKCKLYWLNYLGLGEESWFSWLFCCFCSKEFLLPLGAYDRLRYFCGTPWAFHITIIIFPFCFECRSSVLIVLVLGIAHLKFTIRYVFNLKILRHVC